MATPPTLDADFSTAFDTTRPNTVSVTAASGTTLIAVGANGEVQSGGNQMTTPTGGPTWTLRQQHNFGAVGSACDIAAWSATATGNFTHSQGDENNHTTASGGLVWVYSGSDGYDSSAISYVTTEPPQQAITTTTDNCALIWVAADYQAADDVARDYLTVNGGAAVEDFYFRDASYLTVYAAHWSDAGTAGSKTVGLNTSAATMETSQVAVAAKGSAAVTFPTIRASSTSTAGKDVDKPTGTVDGDLLIAWLGYDSGSGGGTGAFGPPAGWTTLHEVQNGSSVTMGVYWKIASGEGSSFTFTAEETNIHLHCVAITTGTFDATTPIDASSMALDAVAGTAITAPSITTTVANTLLWFAGFVFGSGDGASMTPPTGFTERHETGLGSVTTLETAHKDQAASGSTGAIAGTYVFDPGANFAIASLVAVKPASAVVDRWQNRARTLTKRATTKAASVLTRRGQFEPIAAPADRWQHRRTLPVLTRTAPAAARVLIRRPPLELIVAPPPADPVPGARPMIVRF